MVEKYWTDASSSAPLPPPEQYDAFKGFKAPKPHEYRGPVPVSQSDKAITEQSYERAPRRRSEPKKQYDLAKTRMAPLSELIPSPTAPKVNAPMAPQFNNRFDQMDLPSMQMYLMAQDYDDQTLSELMSLDPRSLREYLARYPTGNGLRGGRNGYLR